MILCGLFTWGVLKLSKFCLYHVLYDGSDQQLLCCFVVLELFLRTHCLCESIFVSGLYTHLVRSRNRNVSPPSLNKKIK